MVTLTYEDNKNHSFII